jgi:hypothetical protein
MVFFLKRQNILKHVQGVPKLQAKTHNREDTSNKTEITKVAAAQPNLQQHTQNKTQKTNRKQQQDKVIECTKINLWKQRIFSTSELLVT